jgi:hypothetical protein
VAKSLLFVAELIKVSHPGLWEILTSVLEVKATLLLRQTRTLQHPPNATPPVFLKDNQPQIFCPFVYASSTKYVARIFSSLEFVFVVQVAYTEPAD